VQLHKREHPQHRRRIVIVSAVVAAPLALVAAQAIASTSSPSQADEETRNTTAQPAVTATETAPGQQATVEQSAPQESQSLRIEASSGEVVENGSAFTLSLTDPDGNGSSQLRVFCPDEPNAPCILLPEEGDDGGDSSEFPGWSDGDGFETPDTGSDADNGSGSSSPVSGFTGPSDNGTAPSGNGTAPSDNGTDPSDNGADPSDNGADPSDNGTDPSDNGTGPGSAPGAPSDPSSSPDATPGNNDAEYGAGLNDGSDALANEMGAEPNAQGPTMTTHVRGALSFGVGMYADYDTETGYISVGPTVGFTAQGGFIEAPATTEPGFGVKASASLPGRVGSASVSVSTPDDLSSVSVTGRGDFGIGGGRSVSVGGAVTVDDEGNVVSASPVGGAKQSFGSGGAWGSAYRSFATDPERGRQSFGADEFDEAVIGMGFEPNSPSRLGDDTTTAPDGSISGGEGTDSLGSSIGDDDLGADDSFGFDSETGIGDNSELGNDSNDGFGSEPSDNDSSYGGGLNDGSDGGFGDDSDGGFGSEPSDNDSSYGGGFNDGSDGGFGGFGDDGGFDSDGGFGGGMV
jgi:hypothetical protein